MFYSILIMSLIIGSFFILILKSTLKKKRIESKILPEEKVMQSKYTTMEALGYALIAKQNLEKAGNLEISDKLFCNYIITAMRIYSKEKAKDKAKKNLDIINRKLRK